MSASLAVVSSSPAAAAAPPKAPLLVGVLGFQGSFQPHLNSLASAKLACRKVTSLSELSECSHLIIPGGESTVQSHFLRQTGMDAEIQRRFRAGGLAVFGTCAGAILLGSEPPPGSADADEGKGGLQPARLDLVPTVLVRRNAYGRQIDSSIRPIAGRGPFEGVALEGAFIRAPKFRIVAGGAGAGAGGAEGAGAASVDVLGVDPAEEDAVVLLRSGRALLCAFHPELTKDTRIHAFFATI